jgi:SAM-dependent methyltransferase
MLKFQTVHDAPIDRRIRCNTPDEYGRLAIPEFADHAMSGWGSTTSQDLRLLALLSLPLRPGDLVVDLGCGSGRLADLLPPEVDYMGIDWSEDVIAEARRRRTGRCFEVGTVENIVRADWVVASGVFNVAAGWSQVATCVTVRKMWRIARRGIAVTVLSRTVETDRLSYSASEMASWLDAFDWVRIEIDYSYLPHDMCLRAWRSLEKAL